MDWFQLMLRPDVTMLVAPGGGAGCADGIVAWRLMGLSCYQVIMPLKLGIADGCMRVDCDEGSYFLDVLG